MRSLLLALLALAAVAAVLLTGPLFAGAAVRDLEAPRSIAAQRFATKGLPVSVKVPKGAKAVYVSLVKLAPAPVRRIAKTTVRVRGGRTAKLRFRVRGAPLLAGNGPFEIRVRAGSTPTRLGPQTLRQRLRITAKRVSDAPVAAPAPPPAPPTAPAPPSTPYVVAAAGDLCGSCKDTAAQVRAMDPARFIGLGDYQYSSAGAGGATFKKGYETTFAGLHAITIPTFGATHDTDDGNGSWEGYARSFFDANGAPEVRGRLTDHQWGYSVELPNGWHLLMLNYDAQDLTKVAADLAGRLGQCTIAATHGPVYGSPSSEHPKNEGAGFAAALNAAGVDVILAGHQHFYERVAYPQGTQFTVGTGGADAYTRTSTGAGSQKYATGVHGALKLTLGAGRWDASFTSTSGSAVDSASGTCAD